MKLFPTCCVKVTLVYNMLEIECGFSSEGLHWWGHFKVYQVLVTYVDLIAFKMLIELHIHFKIRRPS
jgi:hypothetical protein